MDDSKNKTREQLKCIEEDLIKYVNSYLNTSTWQPYKRGVEGRDLCTESLIPFHRTKRSLIALK